MSIGNTRQIRLVKRALPAFDVAKSLISNFGKPNLLEENIGTHKGQWNKKKERKKIKK